MDSDNARLAERVRELEQEVARLRAIVEPAETRTADRPQELPPTPPPPPPHPPTVAPKRPRGDEVSLVGPWMARVGAVALVIGAAFAFKYAIDRGLIGPTARVVLGLIAGAALAAGGEWGRRRDWPGWAQAISGGAIGLWFLSVWAAFELYGLIGTMTALVAFSAIAAAGTLMALRHNSEPLAILATVTAFANPWVIGLFRMTPLGVYVLTVDAAVIVLSTLRSWPLLTRIALLGTWVTVSVGAGLSELGDDEAGLMIPVLFGLAFFAVFLGHALRSGARSGSTDARDLLVVNSFAFLVYGFALTEEHASDWSGAFAASLGVLHLLLGAFLPDSARLGRTLNQALLFLGMAFLVLAVPIQFDGPLLAATWTVQAVVLVALGTRVASRRGGAAGIGLLLLAIFQSLMIEFQAGAAYDPERILISGEAALLALQVAATLVIARLLGSAESAPLSVRQGLLVLAHGVGILWSMMETEAAFRSSSGALPIELGEERAFAVTAVWALYATFTLIAGVLKRSLLNRLVGVGLFGLVILKLVFSDLWLVGPLYRTIAFIGLGVVLLVGSFFYHRFREVILEGNAAAASEREPTSHEPRP